MKVVLRDKTGATATVRNGTLLWREDRPDEAELCDLETKTMIRLTGVLEWTWTQEQIATEIYHFSGQKVSPQDDEPKVEVTLEELPVHELSEVFGIEAQIPESSVTSPGHASLAARLAMKIPGLNDETHCPAPNCGNLDTVYGIVIHLNDEHKQTREQIADWLDTLDIDLSVKEAS